MLSDDESYYRKVLAKFSLLVLLKLDLQQAAAKQCILRELRLTLLWTHCNPVISSSVVQQ